MGGRHPSGCLTGVETFSCPKTRAGGSPSKALAVSARLTVLDVATYFSPATIAKALL
jgi:hypothetical protein